MELLCKVGWNTEVAKLLRRISVEGVGHCTRHYMACISHPGMRIFWAIVARQGWIAVGADAINAFAQAAPPKEPICVRIDDQMAEWMEESTGQWTDRSLVLPVLCALQGHPATGSSWADKVEQLLITELDFTSTTHETCLYIGNYAGQSVLICRQVDDFIAAGKEEDKLRKLFTHLATKINIMVEVGLVSHYNGTGVVQDRDYIKVHVGKYIDKIFSNHGW
jgi:hypothetical protein